MTNLLLMPLILAIDPLVADWYQSFEEAAGLMPARCMLGVRAGETLRRHPAESR